MANIHTTRSVSGRRGLWREACGQIEEGHRFASVRVDRFSQPRDRPDQPEGRGKRAEGRRRLDVPAPL
jgi:hypothetical protein